MKLSELSRKEIIDISKGEKIIPRGELDMIIDERGKVHFLLVDDGKKMFFFGNRYRKIPWESIKNIHEKIIIIQSAKDGNSLLGV